MARPRRGLETRKRTLTSFQRFSRHNHRPKATGLRTLAFLRLQQIFAQGETLQAIIFALGEIEPNRKYQN